MCKWALEGRLLLTHSQIYVSLTKLDKLVDYRTCTQPAHREEIKSQVNRVLAYLNVGFFLVSGTGSIVAAVSRQGLQQEKLSDIMNGQEQNVKAPILVEM